MSIVDLTGRHAVVTNGDVTLHASGGPNDRPYASLGAGGYLQVQDAAGDFYFAYSDFRIVFYARLVTDRFNEVAPGVLNSYDITGYLTNPAWRVHRDVPTNWWMGVEPARFNITLPGSFYRPPEGAWIKLQFVREGGMLYHYASDIFGDDILVASVADSTNFSLGTDPTQSELLVGKPDLGGGLPAGLDIAGLQITSGTTLVLDVLPVAGALPVTTTAELTAVTGAVEVSGGLITPELPAPRLLSGTLSAALEPSEHLYLSMDEGVSWLQLPGSGSTWSYVDNQLWIASRIISMQVRRDDGQIGPLTQRAVTLRNIPTVYILSMEKDDGTPNDWLTSDGSAPRKVYGETSAPLSAGEVVEISFDNVNWGQATVSGTTWEATDNVEHTVSWVIRARVTDSSIPLSSAESSVSVTLVPPQPTVLPQGTYTTLLDIIRRFMERTGLPKPAFSIGNTDTQVAQILGLLEEATEEIVMRNARGWQILNRQAIFQTKAQEVQGSLSELAPGFRAVINDTLFNRTTRLPIYGPLLPMERQATKALQTAGPYYRYWIANDELHFYPIPPAGQTIAFEYTSTAAWSDGKTPVNYSEYPDSDTAICLFPKPVMIAQLRWRWKKEKGLEYAEDFAMAERLLNAAIAADGTRRVIDLGGTELVARPGIMIPTGSWPLK